MFLIQYDLYNKSSNIIRRVNKLSFCNWVSMSLHKIYRYYVIDKEFIDYLYDSVINEGWSFTYACSNIKGGAEYVKTQFDEHPIVREIYNVYLDKVRQKNRTYRYNISLMS